ncbi:unconventional myosin-Va [Cimex lectularius]|uniref:Unconventional myosin-Va n=1 Tax=Cimex lectularius TaxID=79782 RepID=A0A8I6SE97_CIMLE|nr:unconventional myosin-Va [Cimex lectularius]
MEPVGYLNLNHLKCKPGETDLIYKRRFELWAFASQHRDIYISGARVWIPHASKVWEGAKVVENFIQGKLIIVTDDGETKELKIPTDEDLPPLRNPEILIGENDLTSLSYLHEPAVLYNLQVRFCRQNAIYTYCGIVLVAINPYCEISIYDSDTIWAYRGQAMGDLDPHIFAVAEEAYTKLEREQKNQSIIVSGESGAGKTVSAKYVMRYFATVGGSATETQVERKVLASSPIMEAIGNAKTTRNDNSSRFGKFIELQFDKNYTIVGAKMSTYLLEKSRVIVQASEERNYHIFYQICSAKEELKHLSLDDAHTYNYLCDSNNKIQGVNDKTQYIETIGAFRTLDFSKEYIDNIFLILASILHLGNIKIMESGGGDAESCTISANDKHLHMFTTLLDINAKELNQCLCHRRIVSTREAFNKPMTVHQAVGARDALAKHIYACLFAWIVKQMNRALITSQKAKHRFIGVLDIYGFETFETNSFEQFCINYANEKLQQQFNMHVFKLEQEEYYKEEIQWTFIDFYDNQPCIDLIESKLGILDLLDEECRMPKGTDNSWAEKLFAKCSKWNHFAKPRFGANSFILKHFADKVEYEVLGFLEKNRDTVIEEQISVLKSSSNDLIHKLLNNDENSNGDKLAVPKPKVRVSIEQKSQTSHAVAAKNKKTVGSQFRDSLKELMDTLNSTTPHYIRCIKPNDEKEAFKYNPSRAVQQLRACGVLETIRISAAGFPSRWLYTDFLNRYRPLCASKMVNRQNPRETCEKMLTQIIQGQDKCKFGRTKIFFRAGQVAYMERLRSEKLLQSCVKIQKVVRGYLVRRRYSRMVNGTLTIQRFFRGYLARRRVERMRKNKAAIVIQKWVRRWVKQTQYERTRKVILGIQTYGRGYLGRKKYNHMRQTKAAIKIQSAVRGWLQRKKYQKSRARVIIAQSAIRRFLARRRFKKMKREAKSAQHLMKLNKGLENKIISLQQKIGEMTKELNMQKTMAQEATALKSRLSTMQGIEGQLKLTKSQLVEKDKEIVDLTNLLKAQISENDKTLEQWKKKESVLTQDNNKLKSELLKMKDSLKTAVSEKEAEVKSLMQEERKQIVDELSQERLAHQKLLAEKELFESRIETLEKSLGKAHKRSSSDASTVSIQEDVGYASVRSNISSGREETPTPENHFDTTLMLQLQRKVVSLEHENRYLHSKMENEKRNNYGNGVKGAFMNEELEMENARLRADLLELREAVKNDAMSKTGGNKALQQIAKKAEWWEEEAKRARQEAATLRETLGSRTFSTSSLTRSSYPTSDIDPSVINEDGELVLAFEAQKKTLRQIENELQEKTTRWEIEREELINELVRLRSENERQNAMLVNSVGSLASMSEMYLQSELTRLTAENLELNNKYDKKSADYRKLQEQFNELLNKLKEVGVPDVEKTVAKLNRLESQSSLPVVIKKEREFMGMFECKFDDIYPLIKQLLELKPKVAVTLLPGLPAYIIFMVVRYTDYINNELMLQTLILGYQMHVKTFIAKKSKDVDTAVLWLANTLRLVHNLKQYSGEQHFGKDNTPTQQEQCLKNFDLLEFRQVLCDEAVAICQNILKKMQDRIQPLAAGAILDHEAVFGLTTGISRGRSSSVAAPPQAAKASMDELLTVLSNFKRTLNLHGVDPQLHSQFFMQLFYSLCAHSLNILLLRKEYCHWSKGMQIRYNLSNLEQWVREEKIQDTRVLEMLQPIIEASQLLQARKSDEDVESVANMCPNLTANQIIKLLNLYTPVDSYEEKVSESFIRKIQERLKERKSVDGTHRENILMMDAQKSFPLEFPFNPSSIRLEDIEIPDVLHLPMLKKL